MKLICGLGNPGPEYETTRHNAGFMVCDILSRRHNIPVATRKFSGLSGTGMIGSDKILILKPGTFMNRSGQSAGPAMHYFKVELEDLIVIHDDVDLDTGRIVVKQGGGTGGHKGLRSLIQHLGSPDFYRIRFGVGRPDNPAYDTADYVLSGFSKDEEDMVEQALEDAADAVETLLDKGFVFAANRFNANKRKADQ